jgi:hypothetical protein
MHENYLGIQDEMIDEYWKVKMDGAENCEKKLLRKNKAFRN